MHKSQTRINRLNNCVGCSFTRLEFMSQKACKELELYSEWLRENKLSLQYIVVKLNAIILLAIADKQLVFYA
jgi:hypothetical protein